DADVGTVMEMLPAGRGRLRLLRCLAHIPDVVHAAAGGKPRAEKNGPVAGAAKSRKGGNNFVRGNQGGGGKGG
ncbi:MAG: hypothetical protein D6694_15750, partial [Gammaproteobacteria bacterium]